MEFHQIASPPKLILWVLCITSSLASVNSCRFAVVGSFCSEKWREEKRRSRLIAGYPIASESIHSPGNCVPICRSAYTIFVVNYIKEFSCLRMPSVHLVISTCSIYKKLCQSFRGLQRLWFICGISFKFLNIQSDTMKVVSDSCNFQYFSP